MSENLCSKHENIPTLSIVVPCYNEKEALSYTSKVLAQKLDNLISNSKISKNSRVFFVDDGSKDDTWNIIEELHLQNEMFCGIKLSRNEGHQNALLCGLMSLKDKFDVLISIDADLQDDVDAIDEMLEKYKGGAEIVYGVRSSRKNDSFFKKFTAESFYKIINLLCEKRNQIVFNHADYRLMSKKALCALENFKEVNLFLRGIMPMIGFKTDIVYYKRNERVAGESKYPLSKMLSLAINGITNLSVKPLRMITLLGFLIFFSSFLMLGYFLLSYFNGNTVPGWASVIISIWGIGGLLQLSIGICGEYIGKIYLETKQRPRYIVEKILE